LPFLRTRGRITRGERRGFLIGKRWEITSDDPQEGKRRLPPLERPAPQNRNEGYFVMATDTGFDAPCEPYSNILYRAWRFGSQIVQDFDHRRNFSDDSLLNLSEKLPRNLGHLSPKCIPAFR
jgi:hypothetical protein